LTPNPLQKKLHNQEFLMRKFFAAALIITASFGAAFAAQPRPVSSQDDTPNMGIAPKEPNGIGRADIRIVDENGNPVRAQVKLESHRSDGYFCETDWGTASSKGVMVLPPLHMGEVTLKVKANGYRSQTIQIQNSSLAEPIHVTLVRK
jgi:hypothetical protein